MAVAGAAATKMGRSGPGAVKTVTAPQDWFNWPFSRAAGAGAGAGAALFGWSRSWFLVRLRLLLLLLLLSTVL